MSNEATPINRKDHHLSERKTENSSRKTADHSTLVNRRALFTGAAVLAAGTAFGIFKFEQRNDENTIQDDLNTINEHLRELNITPNLDEARILSHFYPDIRDSQLITDEKSAEDEVQSNIDSTFQVMKNSSLPSFRNVITTRNRYGDQINIQKVPNLDVYGKNILMKTTSKPAKDTDNHDILQHVINVSEEAVLRDSSGFLLGTEFVKQTRNVQNRIDYLQLYGGSRDVEGKLELVKEYLKANLIDDEAKAYADQCQAVLEAMGAGYHDPLPTDLMDLTATYIRCGLNPISEKWKDVIYNRILKLKEL